MITFANLISKLIPGYRVVSEDRYAQLEAISQDEKIIQSIKEFQRAYPDKADQFTDFETIAI